MDFFMMWFWRPIAETIGSIAMLFGVFIAVMVILWFLKILAWVDYWVKEFRKE